MAQTKMVRKDFKLKVNKAVAQLKFKCDFVENTAFRGPNNAVYGESRALHLA